MSIESWKSEAVRGLEAYAVPLGLVLSGIGLIEVGRKNNDLTLVDIGLITVIDGLVLTIPITAYLEYRALKK